MPKATRDYGFARDCAVCGARILETPVFEVATVRGTFPMCDYCETFDDRSDINRTMVARRIASGAYKVVTDKETK